jgi:hypothetical protein
MKFSTSLITSALVLGVHGHGGIWNYTIAGKNYSGYLLRLTGVRD